MREPNREQEPPRTHEGAILNYKETTNIQRTSAFSKQTHRTHPSMNTTTSKETHRRTNGNANVQQAQIDNNCTICPPNYRTRELFYQATTSNLKTPSTGMKSWNKRTKAQFIKSHSSTPKKYYHKISLINKNQIQLATRKIDSNQYRFSTYPDKTEEVNYWKTSSTQQPPYRIDIFNQSFTGCFYTQVPTETNIYARHTNDSLLTGTRQTQNHLQHRSHSFSSECTSS
jgi:hypothetical protein